MACNYCCFFAVSAADQCIAFESSYHIEQGTIALDLPSLYLYSTSGSVEIYLLSIFVILVLRYVCSLQRSRIDAPSLGSLNSFVLVACWLSYGLQCWGFLFNETQLYLDDCLSDCCLQLVSAWSTRASVSLKIPSFRSITLSLTRPTSTVCCTRSSVTLEKS